MIYSTKLQGLLTQIIAEENVKPAMEKLTNIRKKIRYGRKMNRRLHDIPFRKIKSHISYVCGKWFQPQVH